MRDELSLNPIETKVLDVNEEIAKHEPVCCPKCGGDGNVNRYVPGRYEWLIKDSYTCDLCHGQTQIEREEAEEWEWIHLDRPKRAKRVGGGSMYATIRIISTQDDDATGGQR